MSYFPGKTEHTLFQLSLIIIGSDSVVYFYPLRLRQFSVHSYWEKRQLQIISSFYSHWSERKKDWKTERIILIVQQLLYIYFYNQFRKLVCFEAIFLSIHSIVRIGRENFHKVY